MILRKKNKPADAGILPVHYDTILSPVVTEKSMMAGEHGKYVFNVRGDSDKIQIKQAIEALFGVKVVKVNTLNREGKTKMFRGRPGKRSDVKKATITLAAGQNIDLQAGVK